MTNNLRSRITGGAIAMAFCAAAGLPAFAETIAAPPVPANLQVPAGNTLFLNTQAVGTQNYVCSPTDSGGVAWKLFGPQATLYLTIRWITGDIRQQVATHYLSMNPAENGTPRATWQSSIDTSAIWGRAIAQSSDPAYVEAGAIPWLLVEIVGSQRGPTGGDFFTPATFIQRVKTSGGVAPSTGCTQPSQLSSTVLVPYTTDYLFYKANRR